MGHQNVNIGLANNTSVRVLQRWRVSVFLGKEEERLGWGNRDVGARVATLEGAED